MNNFEHQSTCFKQLLVFVPGTLIIWINLCSLHRQQQETILYVSIFEQSCMQFFLEVLTMAGRISCVLENSLSKQSFADVVSTLLKNWKWEIPYQSQWQKNLPGDAPWTRGTLLLLDNLLCLCQALPLAMSGI